MSTLAMPTIETDPKVILSDVFGYEAFRPNQEAIIQSLIAGEDNFVLMPTGGGKSLCFQIPALARQGVGIVVSPLISLMQDQVHALQANGVAATFYNSALNAQQAKQVLAQLHAGELDLLYVAPERLVLESFVERLKEIEIALFAIDEAHCVSQWGHDFRPEYAQLNCLPRLFPQVPMIALTATADKQTRQDIVQRLALRQPQCRIASFDRPNIRYTVAEKHKPFSQLVTFLKTRPGESGIVYCFSRKRVDETAARLQAEGFKTLPYHAGLSTAQRQQAQDDFQKDNVQIIVATVAFGMGIDKPNVRFVVHFDMPKNIENYYQETGRAGRDNLPAEALLLFGLGDIAKIRGLIEPMQNDQQKRIELHKLNAMVGFADAQTCRRRVLLNYFDESLQKDCGNCDVCLNPPNMYDATEDARKALSCVYRVNQRFGLMHVVEVLCGSTNKRVKSFGHDQLSTYGIGQHLSSQAWYSIFRQLIHRGFLEQDIAHYSVLKLTEASRPLLRGEIQLQLAKPTVRVHEKKKTASKPKSKAALKTELDYDKGLFEALRELRKKIADEANVPPFIVFGDVSLLEMAALRPVDEQAFLAINGVGQRKLESYGEAFMKLIRSYT